MDFSRPTVMGVIEPGNSTELRSEEDGQRFGYRIVFRKFVFVFGNYRDDLAVSLLNVGNIRQDIYLYLIAFLLIL